MCVCVCVCACVCVHVCVGEKGERERESMHVRKEKNNLFCDKKLKKMACVMEV